MKQNTLNIINLKTFIHCKETIQKIRNKDSQKRNFLASVPNSTFMCLWAIYIFPWLICLCCCRKICGPILGINKSLTYTWMGIWEYINGISVVLTSQRNLYSIFLLLFPTKLEHFLTLSFLSLPASHLCHQGLGWPCLIVRSFIY